MSNNATSFRLPINVRGLVHDQVASALENHDDAINDLQQAIQYQGKSTSSSSSTTTSTSSTSSSSSGSTESVTVSSSSSTSTIGTVNDQTGITSYTTTQSDYGNFIILNDASAVSITLSTLGTSPSITIPWYATFINSGSGTVTITPGSGTINGTASFALLSSQVVTTVFDGTNFEISPLLALPMNTSAISHEWINSYSSTTGQFTQSQPAFSDISGIAASSQLPTPTTTAIGGVEAVNAVSHEWVNSIDSSGVPHLSQPAFTDVSGQITTSQLPASGVSGSVSLDKLTTGGTNGSLTVLNGVITAIVNPT